MYSACTISVQDLPDEEFALFEKMELAEDAEVEAIGIVRSKVPPMGKRCKNIILIMIDVSYHSKPIVDP